MAYRIFFSGLVVFVEYGGFEKVDALLLNPCDMEGHAHGTGGEESCHDHHSPQLMVKGTDIAEWQQPGVLHGCGWHHFDLTGKVATPLRKEDAPYDGRPRLVTRPTQGLEERYETELEIDPFGTMRHVSFENGIPDMATILPNPAAGQIDLDRVNSFFRNFVAARVCLPGGELTALAPLDNSARRAFAWQIGGQRFKVLGEIVMFVPRNDISNRIDLTGHGYVTVKNRPNVTVWITNEPLRSQRGEDAELRKAEHFKHYYRLLRETPNDQARSAHDRFEGRPEPTLELAAANIDTPLCPPCLMHTDKELPDQT